MTEVNDQGRVRFGAYEADLHTHELWKHDIKVKLVGQPFEILAMLIARPGQLVTREELRQQLWPGDTFVDFNHGLNAAVNKLRDALCDSADDPKFIETLPRRGYRFIAAVDKSVGDAVLEPKEPAHEPELQTPVAEDAVPWRSSEVSIPGSSVPNFGARSSSLPPAGFKRWPFYLAAGLALFFVVLWVVVSDLRFYWPGNEEKREAERRGMRGKGVASGTPLTSFADVTSEPAFSPDGNRVAFRRESFLPGSSGIWVEQVGGEELIQLTSVESDFSPVWSPDGREIAFSRITNNERTIYSVPAKGGELRKLHVTRASQNAELDWAPDSQSIAYVAETAQGTSAIFVLSVPDGKVRQITNPSAVEWDWGPAFSPDGEQILFLRKQPTQSPLNVMVMPSGGGEVRRVATEPAQVNGPPVWSADGQSIVFVAIDSNGDGLWRVPASGGVPTPIREAGGQVGHPAISRRGFRLAYQQISSARIIEQIVLFPPGQVAHGLVTSVRCENASPQFSPDGEKLLFMSDRAGGMDIWVSERNGANPIQLTAVGTAGAPRWSPDGKSIAFDVGMGRDWQQPRAIFTVSSDGGVPRPIVQDRFNNPAPSWSRDGAWIYFPSDRSGSWQVWKVPATGGTLVPVTTQGGFAAWEASDHYVYYAKHRDAGPELWRIPVGGGAEAPVFPRVQPLDWAAWAVVEKGILFVEAGGEETQSAPTLSFFDFANLRVTHLAVLQTTPFWLGAATDGKSVVFDHPENAESRVMLLENFR